LLSTTDRHAPLAGLGFDVLLLVHVTDVADERLYLLQGPTIIHVVRHQLALPLLGVTDLPLLPPDDTLQPGSVRLRPRAAQAASHILQTVGVTGEVEVGVDYGEQVH